MGTSVIYSPLLPSSLSLNDNSLLLYNQLLPNYVGSKLAKKNKQNKKELDDNPN